MQLGARWRAGEPPHRGVPAALHPLIAEQEAAHPAAVSWTLTWLEGRPRCALEDVVTVTLDAAGAAVVLPGAGAQAAVSGGADGGSDDDDDDDWLR